VVVPAADHDRSPACPQAGRIPITNALNLAKFKLKKCKTDTDCLAAGLSVCVNKKCLMQSGLPPPTASVDVDNFKCYKAKVHPASSFSPVSGVVVTENEPLDPMAPLGTIYEIKKPSHLCMPVDKDGESPGAEAHPLVLMCYQAKRAKGIAKYVRHRIGVATSFPAQMRIDQGPQGPREICVPAVVPTPAAG
jgi:hypothetical protein